MYFEQHPHEYHAWKLEKLGPERYEKLVEKFNKTQKKTKQFMEETRARIEEMLDAVERI